MFISCIGNPYFSGDKQLFPGDSAFLNGTAYGFFIPVSLCGIDRTVAHIQGVRYTSFAFFLVRNLVYPIA
ncbi:hypothetical protein D3C74_411730 [compost metagenome]